MDWSSISKFKLKKKDLLWLLPYVIPFLFLAMWLDWTSGATEMIFAEVLLAAVPVCALAWWNGQKGRTFTFLAGNFLVFYSNQMSLFWGARQLPEEAFAQWSAHFSPAGPEVVFLKWWFVLLILQAVIFLVAMRYRKGGKKGKNGASKS